MILLGFFNKHMLRWTACLGCAGNTRSEVRKWDKELQVVKNKGVNQSSLLSVLVELLPPEKFKSQPGATCSFMQHHATIPPEGPGSSWESLRAPSERWTHTSLCYLVTCTWRIGLSVWRSLVRGVQLWPSEAGWYALGSKRRQRKECQQHLP